MHLRGPELDEVHVLVGETQGLDPREPPRAAEEPHHEGHGPVVGGGEDAVEVDRVVLGVPERVGGVVLP